MARRQPLPAVCLLICVVVSCVFVFGVFALGCGGSTKPKLDAGGEADSGRDSATAPDLGGSETAMATGAAGAAGHPFVDGAAGGAGGPADGGDDRAPGDARPTADADPDAASERPPGGACILDCPSGPCPVRDGVPAVLASGPPKERVAALAVRADAVYYGTIADDIFARGRLSKLTPSTGVSSLVVDHVQVSRIQLDADGTIYYWADEVQSTGVRLSSLVGAGPPMVVNANDHPIPGFVHLGENFYTETAIGGGGLIWNDFPNGSGLVAQFIDGVPHGLAVDDQFVYWTKGDGPSRLVRLGVNEISSNDDRALALTMADDRLVGPLLDGGNLYFAHQHAAGACAGSVAVMPAAGGTPRQVSLGRSGSDASSFAVDGTYVYWTTPDAGGLVFRAPKAGGTPEIIASGQVNAANVTSDATRVYWIAAGAAGDEVRAVAK